MDDKEMNRIWLAAKLREARTRGLEDAQIWIEEIASLRLKVEQLATEVRRISVKLGEEG